ncbi:segregation and condensation protein B [Butyrivibrio sp. ob235]|uniref:hypothetical protein n=1 Tax=Butyrivibrio sp. ob235 TaxID=1761780 RepID=UPI0008BEB20E|nr:hypothetical protein [Butyrivibrio sp. ob235]SEK64436.1 segregation and condensation protein B [Butyrivibrio sp. ob235]
MNVNLGKGFGPLDFDENGKMFSLFPENLPYVDDDFDGNDADFTVYVDAELVEAVCNAGLDFEEFLRAEEDERREMLEDAGLNPNDYELDFDRDVRERLEEEGYYDMEYDGDFEEAEDDEYDFEEDDDDEDDEDEYDEEDESDEDYDEDEEDFEDDSEDNYPDEDDEDDDYPDEEYGSDDDFGGDGRGGNKHGDSGDAFFGNLGR